MMRIVLGWEEWMTEALHDLCEKMWDGTTEFDVMKDIAMQNTLAWVPEYAPECLVLTQTIDHPRGRELYLYGITGAGIIKFADEFVADLRELARANGCSMIGAEAVVPGWEKITSRLGFRPVATHYLMELSDGR